MGIIQPYYVICQFVFYRTTNHGFSNDCINLKSIWEKDIGAVIGDEEWKIILRNAGKYVREARGQFTQYKIIHRFDTS